MKLNLVQNTLFVYTNFHLNDLQKSQAKSSPAKDADEVKTVESDIQSTPVSKRIATKRKLTDEPAETDDSKKGTLQIFKKVSKTDLMNNF